MGASHTERHSSGADQNRLLMQCIEVLERSNTFAGSQVSCCKIIIFKLDTQMCEESVSITFASFFQS